MHAVFAIGASRHRGRRAACPIVACVAGGGVDRPSNAKSASLESPVVAPSVDPGARYRSRLSPRLKKECLGIQVDIDARLRVPRRRSHLRDAEQVVKRSRIAVQPQIGERPCGSGKRHCRDDSGNRQCEEQLDYRESGLATVHQAHAPDSARTVPSGRNGAKGWRKSALGGSDENRRHNLRVQFRDAILRFWRRSEDFVDRAAMLIGPRFKARMPGSMTFRSPTTTTASLSG